MLAGRRRHRPGHAGDRGRRRRDAADPRAPRDLLSCCASSRGLVALTKTDLVEPDWLELVREDVAGLVAGTFLEGGPIVPVSVEDGRGAAPSCARRSRDLAARGAGHGGPIDRRGCRSTGSSPSRASARWSPARSWPGASRVDDRVEVYPRGLQAKVRGLQAHGQPVTEASAGQRTAVNLQGVERAAIERGDVVAPAGTLVPTLLAGRHARAAGRRAAAGQDARPRPLPRRHAAR